MEFAQAQPSISKRFYLTGGTALSGFYFKHRLSEDIDLFSEKEVNPRVVEAFLKGGSSKLGIANFSSQNFLGIYTYKLVYTDGEVLKVDFNYYPFPRIEKGVYFKNLEVSSIYDIAVNKVHTIGMNPRTRDYVDLFFVFKNSEENPTDLLKKMRIDSQAKFDWPLEIKNLATALLRASDFEKKDYPEMLVPFDPKEMEKFFLALAKSLEKDIFK